MVILSEVGLKHIADEQLPRVIGTSNGNPE